MGLRSLLAGAVVLSALLVCSAPAHAVETGVNETLGHTMPTPRTADRLGADWVRLWALVAGHGARAGRSSARTLVASLDAEVRRAEGARGEGARRRPPRAGVGVRRPRRDRAAVRPGGVRRASWAGSPARCPGVDAWELWNEPDERPVLGRRRRPARLRGAAPGRLPGDQGGAAADVVVTGGMVGNNFDFLAALYATARSGAFDAVGVHTDTACLTDGPGAYYRDPQGRIGRYTFSAYREVHAVMADHGDGAKPIWMTELGWNTQATRRLLHGRQVGRARSRSASRESGRRASSARPTAASPPTRSIGVALWFGIQDIRGSRHAGGYGLYRRGGRAKPAAQAFRKLDEGIRPRRGCGGYVDRTAADDQRAQPIGRAPLQGQGQRPRARVRQPRRDGDRADQHGARRRARDVVALARLDLAVVGERGLDARRPHAHLHRQGPREQRDDDVGAGRQAAPR